MPIKAFLLWSALGSFIWTSVLTGVGYFLESRYQQIVSWLDPVSRPSLLRPSWRTCGASSRSRGGAPSRLHNWTTSRMMFDRCRSVCRMAVPRREEPEL